MGSGGIMLLLLEASGRTPLSRHAKNFNPQVDFANLPEAR